MIRVLLTLLIAAVVASADPRLPALFSDHMVLQQRTPVSIWGWAEPGEGIEVALGANPVQRTQADSAGRWMVRLGPLGPGGPFTMAVRGTRTVVVRDVMVGEVWVLSGQSNMAFPLSRASTAESAIQGADQPAIRLFTVPKKNALEAVADVSASWEVCSPASAQGFSAVGYFFGAKLHRQLGVPIGLIHTSWPGTRAEQWTPRDLMEADPVLAPLVRQARPWTELGTYSLEFDDFELLRSPDGSDREPLTDFDDGSCAKCSFDWNADNTFAIAAPGHGGSAFAARIEGQLDPARTSALQFRYRDDKSPVDLSMYTGLRFRFRGDGLFRLLSVQPTISDADNYRTPVFRATDDWQTAVVPFSSLKQAGWGKQLPFTPFALTAFKIRTDAGDIEMPPAGLFNAMIAPLVRFAIRGAVWYQGESNAGRAWQYRTLLPALIRGWRRAWEQGEFPFLIVQLPNFGRDPVEPSHSAWAELREAQFITSQDVPNCGLAVTIDLGAADDVHPTNKEPVGDRLALQALTSVYGREMVSAGPVFESIDVEGKMARLRFEHLGAGLATRHGEPLRGFAVAGADRRFVWADARIDGDTVLVWSAAVDSPVAVRYGWANNPDCNLINKEDLPAAPFRTDDWPLSTMPKP